MKPKAISLVGMPGGGKSTVGRHLAKRIGWRFADTDALIEQRLGCSIRAFFQRSGEEAFRDIESEVIAETINVPCSVISTGGGAVLRERNRALLHSATWVVYLRSTPEELHRRLRHDKTRPLLQVDDPLGKLRELFIQRDPVYSEVAHFVVETGRPTVATLVNTVLMQLELAGVIDGGMGVLPPGAPVGQ